MLQGGRAEMIFVQSLKETIADARLILDVGTSQRFAKELRPYEDLFDGKQYIAAGYRPKTVYEQYNCDCHQDIHNLTLRSCSLDAVLCIEVLEHVANPFQAVREIKRVLRPGGRLLLTTPFLTTYHGKGRQDYAADHESYPDFWRFTHQGLEALFRDCHDVRIVPLDGPIELRLKEFHMTRYLGVPIVRKLIDLLDRPQLGKATTRHMVCAIK